MKLRQDVLVIGAGMVGTTAAANLLAHGWTVTLVDRKAPGEETSYGNAGVIAGPLNFQAALPPGFPEFLKIALNRTSYFRYNPLALHRTMPWLWKFWRASTPEKLDDNARRSHGLFALAVPEHLKMARSSGAIDLIKDTGWLHVTRQEGGLPSLRREQGLAAELGAHFDVLTGNEIIELEPSLRFVARSGVHWKGVHHTGNPGKLTKAYASAFVAAGGSIIQGAVAGLRPCPDFGWEVTVSDRRIEAGHVVVAAGAWSGSLIKPLGYRLPLGTKRGYHQHFQFAENVKLTRPVKDSDYGYVLAPMAQGVRLSTGVEIDFPDAATSSKQLQRVLPHARELFPLGPPIEDAPWLGHRPTFPDQLPMIGPAPHHKRLWFNFGHAHWGLTLGPASGRLLAEMMGGRTPCVDPTSYSPKRFG